MTLGRIQRRLCPLSAPAALTSALVGASILGSSLGWGADKVTPTPETDDKPLVEMRCPVRDPQHVFQRDVWSWRELKDKNVVKQNRDYSCGAASLCTLLKYYWGDNVTEQKILDTVDKMLTPEE